MSNEALLVSKHFMWVKLTRIKLKVFALYQQLIEKSSTQFVDLLPPEESKVASEFFAEVFPPIEFGALFLMSYSHIESALNSLCFSFENIFDSTRSLKDFKGMGIARAKDFLSQSDFKIKSIFANAEWQKMVEISQVRNVIVHCSGEIDKSNKKHLSAVQFAKKYNAKVVGSEERERIEITKDFLLEAIRVYESFLQSLEVCIGKSFEEAIKLKQQKVDIVID